MAKMDLPRLGLEVPKTGKPTAAERDRATNQQLGADRDLENRAKDLVRQSFIPNVPKNGSQKVPGEPKLLTPEFKSEAPSLKPEIKATPSGVITTSVTPKPVGTPKSESIAKANVSSTLASPKTAPSTTVTTGSPQASRFVIAAKELSLQNLIARKPEPNPAKIADPKNLNVGEGEKVVTPEIHADTVASHITLSPTLPSTSPLSPKVVAKSEEPKKGELKSDKKEDVKESGGKTSVASARTSKKGGQKLEAASSGIASDAGEEYSIEEEAGTHVVNAEKPSDVAFVDVLLRHRLYNNCIVKSDPRMTNVVQEVLSSDRDSELDKIIQTGCVLRLNVYGGTNA